MTTVKEIEQAVASLPASALEEFRAWFERFEAAKWDRQIEQDVRAGKLKHHTEEALKDLEEGRCTEL
jgi:hypothetical protein